MNEVEKMGARWGQDEQQYTGLELPTPSFLCALRPVLALLLAVRIAVRSNAAHDLLVCGQAADTADGFCAIVCMLMR